MPSPASRVQPLSGTDRFRLLVDAVTDHAIYMIDSEGFIQTWSEGCQAIMGYLPSEIVGQHFSRLFLPEDRAAGLPDRLRGLAAHDGRYEEEGWRLRKDGTRFRVRAALHRIMDDAGRTMGFANVTRDITATVAAHEALAQSDRRFRLLVQGLIDHAMYMLDTAGTVTSWNAGAERLKGYSADEIVGKHFSRFYTPEDRAAGLPAQVLDTALRTGHFEGEGWRVRKDGSRFWASVVVDAIHDEHGNLEGFAKITRDITERRAAQQALQDSERQFRLMIDNVTDYGLIMLDPNGVVTSWNVGAQRIKGYAANEIIGQHFSRFYPERDRASGLPMRALEQAAREGRYESEGWRMRKDGSLIWTNAVIDRITDETGRLVGFAKITRDITDKRKAQLALEEAQGRQAYAQKMEALGQLTGGVAHDFNNLLMIVTGFLGTLRRVAEGNEKATFAANAIDTAAQRGVALTRQLLSFARRQPFDPSVIEIEARVAASRAMLLSILAPTVELRTEIQPELWQVKVDVNELELALVNLGLNARDAMPEGGTITIGASNVVLDGNGSPSGLSGEFVVLRVSDTGMGIAPDVLPKVFDPFFTTKPSGKGSGLGLAQVYGFAQQSGGAATIDSELGRGTTVSLYLPRSVEQTAADDARTATRGNGSERVLLVEDNPDVRAVTHAMLDELGFTVDDAADAAAAQNAMTERDYGLVVSDIVMAGSMDGISLARTIRSERPEQPIVLMTGYSERARQAATEFTVLSKPFRLEDLSRATARALAEAHQEGESNVVRLSTAPRRPS